MKKESTSEIFGNLSGIFVGLVAIIGAVLPIFSSKYLSYFFVDDKAIMFTSVIGLIILILTSWFSASLDFFIFLNGNFRKIFQYRFWTTTLMLFSIVLIYSSMLLYESHIFSYDIAAILQMFFYQLFFFSAGITFGVTLHSTVSTVRNKQIQSEWNERIINTLSKQGYINLNLKILTFSSHNYVQGELGDFSGGYDVSVLIGDKHYLFQFTWDLERIVKSIDFDTLQQLQEMDASGDQLPSTL